MNISEKCQCDNPTKNCPFFGNMMGRRWQICQGINISEEQRLKYLEIFYNQFANPSGEKPPSIFQQATNFGKAILRHAATGFEKADDNIINERVSSCYLCDKLDSENMQCRECGCFIKIKASWISENCHLGKWKIPEIPKRPRDCGCNKNR